MDTVLVFWCFGMYVEKHGIGGYGTVGAVLTRGDRAGGPLPKLLFDWLSGKWEVGKVGYLLQQKSRPNSHPNNYSYQQYHD